MTESGKQKSHKQTVWKLFSVVILMFGFGYALVPLYNVFCDVFGINGKFTGLQDGSYQAQVPEPKLKPDLNRKVNVQFMTSLNNNLDWEFRTLTNAMEVHPGEIYEVKFYAKNLTGRRVIAQAVPSLVPGKAVKYFSKMECFCFTQQTFAVGESREMPLRFYIDPALPKDVGTVSLAYTFFEAPGSKAASEVTKPKLAVLSK